MGYKSDKELIYLQNKGAAGKYILNKNWSGHPLGNSSGWPQSLKTVLNLVLNNPLPAFLLWSDEVFIFPNNKFIKNYLAETNLDEIIGCKIDEVIPGFWKSIKEEVDQLYKTGGYFEKTAPTNLFEHTAPNGNDQLSLNVSSFNNKEDKTAGVIALCIGNTPTNLAHNLIERNKEQDCLHKISRLRESQATVEGYLRSVVELLPRAMHYSEFAEAVIEFDGKIYTSKNYNPPGFSILSENVKTSKSHLLVKLVYTKKNPSSGNSPFLEEEKKLLQTAADQIALAIDSYYAGQNVKTALLEKNQILDRITDGFLALNNDWTISFFNQTAEKLLGKKQYEVLGKNFWTLFPEIQKMNLSQVYKTVLKERKSVSIQEYFEPLNAWFDVNIYPAEDGISVYFKDITEEMRLQEINERTEQITGVAGWEFDVNTNDIFMTQKGYEIYGVSEFDLTPQEINQKLFDKESLELIDRTIKNAIENKTSYQLELQVKNKDQLVQVNGFPLVEGGKVTKIFGTLEDITKERKEQRELKKLYTVASKIHNGVIITGADRRIEWVNKGYTNMTGFTLGESIGEKPGDLLQGPETDPKTIQRISKKLDRQIPFSEEILNYTKSGDKYWIKMDVTPIFDEGGDLSQYIAIQENITQRKHLEELLEQVYSMAKIGGWEYDIKNNELSWTPVTSEIYEMPADYKPDPETATGFFKKGIHRDTIELEVEKAIKEGVSFDVELKIVTGKGNEKWVRSMGRSEFSDGKCTRIYGSIQDIHQRKKTENKLKETEQKLREIIGHSTNLFYSHTTDHVLTYLSPQSQDFFGYSPEEAALRWTEFITDHPINKKAIEITNKALETGEPQPPYELQLKKANGEIVWVEAHESPVIKDGEIVGIAGSLTDITERKKAEDKLKESLKEKETLLAEIHHRVKNNLAIVSGLMQLQAFNANNEELAHLLTISVSRIRSIAGIHEQLYQSKNFSNIDLAENLERLTKDITNTMEISTKINKEFNMEPVNLSMNQALPCSLIVNEVITNTLKHAFSNMDEGTISVILKEADNRVSLEISDNGIGLPDDFDIKKSESLGMELINTLSEQLGAKISYKPYNKGTRFIIVFQKADSIPG